MRWKSYALQSWISKSNRMLDFEFCAWFLEQIVTNREFVKLITHIILSITLPTDSIPQRFGTPSGLRWRASNTSHICSWHFSHVYGIRHPPFLVSTSCLRLKYQECQNVTSSPLHQLCNSFALSVRTYVITYAFVILQMKYLEYGKQQQQHHHTRRDWYKHIH